ncbi:MAG: nuclear transport factor 2 family protein [Gammaproteobacteria bacterium]|nr:nuclear transport factor 2 family protein [Gammaproteobacteria bacterium]
MSTESVIRHHIQALADGDLGAIMDDYAATCVFISNDQLIRGVAGIRSVFERAVANGGFAVEMRHEIYHGTTAYITWTVPGLIDLGTDTFIVENDEITLQTSAVAMTK